MDIFLLDLYPFGYYILDRHLTFYLLLDPLYTGVYGFPDTYSLDWSFLEISPM